MLRHDMSFKQFSLAVSIKLRHFYNDFYNFKTMSKAVLSHCRMKLKMFSDKFQFQN